VTLFFDTPFSGAATLKLTKAGEIGGEPLLLLVNKTPTSSVDIVLTNLARTEITVELAEKSVNFAIEGEAYEIKS
jgi:hypothetical protein